MELINYIEEIRKSSRVLVREWGMLDRFVFDEPISHSQFHALKEIDIQGKLTQKDLVALLNLDKSVISRMLQDLEKKYLIAYLEDVNDRRKKYILLTEKGADIVNRVNKKAQEQVQGALESLSDDDRQVVLKGLKLYGKALKNSNMQAQYNFRPILDSDNLILAQLIGEILREFGLVGPGFVSSDPDFFHLSKTYNRIGHAYFVCEKKSNSQIVGGVGFAPLKGADSHVAELQKMYLLPECRGKGIGDKLLNHCLESARASGYIQMYLETTSAMIGAQQLYKKFGFQYLSKPMGQTGHGGCDVWMQRWL